MYKQNDLRDFTTTMAISVRLGIHAEKEIDQQKVIEDEEVLPNEDNLLMTTWLEDEAYPQKEGDEKVSFFVNESILAKEEMIEHFSR